MQGQMCVLTSKTETHYPWSVRWACYLLYLVSFQDWVSTWLEKENLSESFFSGFHTWKSWIFIFVVWFKVKKKKKKKKKVPISSESVAAISVPRCYRNHQISQNQLDEWKSKYLCLDTWNLIPVLQAQHCWLVSTGANSIRSKR